MKIDLQNLPTDPNDLHRIIAELIIEKESLSLEKGLLLAENKLLNEQLALLKAKRFGKSSEKLEKQIADLELQIEEGEQVLTLPAAETEDQAKDEEQAPEPRKNKPKRLKLPEHLPRIDNLIEPPKTCPSCGSENWRKIADDVSETLEFVPSSLKVIRHIRPRCACTTCEQIVQGYAPSNTIDKGKAGPGMLAHILVQKYANHLPLYRQSQIYMHEGLELSRSTMASWAGKCARLLEPLIDELKKHVFASSEIHGDDTPIRVLGKGIGKYKTGRIWCYVTDGRPHGASRQPAVCYFYSPDRKGERPAAHLENFSGTLHADAYAGYDKLYGEKISEAACWAHTRRKFYEVTQSSDNAVIATSAIEEIGKLYQIEEEIRGLEPAERLKIRQEKTKPLVEAFFSYLKKNQSKLPSQSATSKAINYAFNNQEALMHFITDGRIEIDNNAAERAMRSIAIGRKNWLFAGSDSGGETAASIYSLIETAKLNKLNPWLYLREVLTLIQDQKLQKLDELLPWNITLPPLIIQPPG